MQGERSKWHLRAGGHGSGSLLDQLMASRGISEQERVLMLRPSLEQLTRATEFPGAVDAAQRILRAIDQGQPLMIFGDYDVDGTGAIAVLVQILRMVRPDASVGWTVPARNDGYGLNCDAVRAICTQESGLLVTVDCGINSRAEISLARELGWSSIVIDHHEFTPETVAPADVIVHPMNAVNPLAMCACAVAWKVACCLATEAQGAAPTGPVRTLLAELLPLAAMATVADVQPLERENRVIVACGLEKFTTARLPALVALREKASGLSLRKYVTAQDIGFQIGPLLNAVGRLEHAREVVELLCIPLDSPDGKRRADELVVRFGTINAERKNIHRRSSEEARADVKERRALNPSGPFPHAIVLWNPTWLPGIVGLIAANVADLVKRPTIAFCQVGGVWRGSGRAGGSFPLHEALFACKSIMLSGGGHAAAVGVSIALDQREAFERMFLSAVDERWGDGSFEIIPPIDGSAHLNRFTVNAVNELARAGPFGRGFDTPKFLLHNFIIDDVQQMKNHTWAIKGRQSNASGLADSHGRIVFFSSDDLAHHFARGVRLDVVVEVTIGDRGGVDLFGKDIVLH